MEETDLEKGLDTLVFEAGQEEEPTREAVAGAAEEKPSAAADAGRRSRPNLYDEVRKAMGGAFLIYAVADIRDFAKKGLLKSDDHPEYIQRLIDLPIDAFEFITLYRENKEIIQKRIDSMERYEMYASFFEIPEDSDAHTTEQYLRSVQFLHFSDSNAEEECVFALTINHFERRVSVAFRGSVTAKDFTQDAKVRTVLYACLAREKSQSRSISLEVPLSILLKHFVLQVFISAIPNPVVRIAEDATDFIDPHLILRMKDNVMVHLGFRQYLYGNETKAFKKVKSHNKDTTKTPNDNADIEEGESTGIDIADEVIEITHEDKKLYQIILDMVSAVIKDHPGYELYVCGHSLGGALATMLGKYITLCERYCANPVCEHCFPLSNLSFFDFTAFEAAATSEEYIPKPVTCITTAAPKVS
jgi:hypothetical protein